MATTRDDIENRIIDLFAALFEQLFTSPFTAKIESRLRRNQVTRTIEEAADAASQSITRLLLNERLALPQVDALVASYADLGDHLELDTIGNANVAPESIVETLPPHLRTPALGGDERLASIYRVALHGIVQAVTLIGPVMAEWRRVGFSTTFEVLRRVVDRLNRMSQQLEVLGHAGPEAADERYELIYRDYLMQRFHRVETGTVKMTTNLDVDLRELFVMPRVLPRKGDSTTGGTGVVDLMNLSAARKRFQPTHETPPNQETDEKEKPGLPALDLLPRGQRWVIVGTPGSGKSTFFEWLQIRVAMAEEVELILAGGQAIPLLLRVRQLDPNDLPTGPGLIASATASGDQAKLAPPGWLHRMMEQGRVVFMLDGLDEIEPVLLRERLLPWLAGIVRQYPNCRYLISSRPSGYPVDTLSPLEFAEADLLDFDAAAIAEYTSHWCVAVRLARNEPESEARQEGARDGEQIVQAFRNHSYIKDLARNPLMLSAVCLVNYFEGGQLPADRAMLYRLCVEGLLHHWDQRRGIHSAYTLDEKLRVCRELAIAMQADDRAEYAAEDVRAVFAAVLADPARATVLLEHIRHRTGLLIERRPGVFAFTHLTFQEYLAAQAIHQGNRRGVATDTLVRGHADPRWREVIPLYSGSGTDAAARAFIEELMGVEDSGMRGILIADAYLASERGLADDKELRMRVLDTIAGSTGTHWPSALDRFPEQEVAPVANHWLGKRVGEEEETDNTGEAFRWFRDHEQAVDSEQLWARLLDWRRIRSPMLLAELVATAHRNLDPARLDTLALETELYQRPGPWSQCQGGFALMTLSNREFSDMSSFPMQCLLIVLQAIPDSTVSDLNTAWSIAGDGLFPWLFRAASRYGLTVPVLQQLAEKAENPLEDPPGVSRTELIREIKLLDDAMDRERQPSGAEAMPLS